MKILLTSFTVQPFYAYSLYLLRTALVKSPFFKNSEVVVKEFDFYENQVDSLRMDGFLEFSSQIKKIVPQIICFSLNAWNEKVTVSAIKLCKQLDSNVKVFVGGPGFISERYCRQFLQCHKEVDLVFRGDVEVGAVEAIKKFEDKKALKKINGIGFRDGKKAILTETKEASELLSPYLSDDFCLKVVKNVALIETYRGCMQNCSYCLWSKRKRKVKEWPVIEAELDKIIERRVPHAFFIDPYLGYNKETALKILKHVSEKNKGTQFGGFLNLFYVDENFCQWLKKAGFLIANVGVQTVSERGLKSAKRVTLVKAIEEKIGLLKRHGLEPRSIDLIYGLPSENHALFKKGVDVVYRFGKERLFIHGLMVLPGSEYYENSEKHGLKSLNEPPWGLIENKTYSLKDVVLSKKLHIGHELVAKKMPISFDITVELSGKNPSDLMEEAGFALVEKCFVNTDFDVFDFSRKMKGYDDGFRKDLVQFIYGIWKRHYPQKLRQRMLELLDFESVNYFLDYFSSRYAHNDYSFIPLSLTFSSRKKRFKVTKTAYLKFLKDSLDSIPAYSYRVDKVRNLNDLKTLPKKQVRLTDIASYKKPAH